MLRCDLLLSCCCRLYIRLSLLVFGSIFVDGTVMGAMGLMFSYSVVYGDFRFLFTALEHVCLCVRGIII